jgi:hypothetical protein
MDPLAAWKELLEALVEMDWERVQESAENLLDWITHGGFPPEVIVMRGDGKNNPARYVYGREFNRAVVDSACRFAIQLANEMLKNASQNSADVAFSLSCIDCDIDSPETHDAAIQSGWTQIRFVPESPAENFLGLCPECRKLSESPH